MKISLVILTFNGAEYLPDLIASIGEIKWPTRDFEIIFVDNASKDNSVEILRNCSLDNMQLMLNSGNLGYTGGNNVGMRKALEEKSDYIILLNQDTVVEPEWVEELVRAAENRPDAGAIQPLILYWGRENIVNSWGNIVHFLGFEFAGGNFENLSALGQDLQVREVTYCSGAAVLYRSSVLKEVGLFDEMLGSYHEDADICLRMRLKGYKSYLAPRSVIYHKYEFIKSYEGIKAHYKYYLMERNRLYTLLKFYRWKTLAAISPAWFIMELGLIFYAFAKGFGVEKFKGYVWIIKNFKQILRKRKELQDSRLMGDRDLTRDFVSVINYREINNPLLQRIANPMMDLYWRSVRGLVH